MSGESPAKADDGAAEPDLMYLAEMQLAATRLNLGLAHLTPLGGPQLRTAGDQRRFSDFHHRASPSKINLEQKKPRGRGRMQGRLQVYGAHRPLLHVG